MTRETEARIDIVERLRSNAVLAVCPFNRLSPEYLTTADDKPCAYCGGEPGRWQKHNGYGWDNAELRGSGWSAIALGASPELLVQHRYAAPEADQ